MKRERDSLERLCRRARAHEEPSASDRAFVRQQLAARLAAAGVVAAAAATAGKAAASGSAPALGVAGSATATGAGALKLGSLVGVGAWLAGGASMTAATVLLVYSFSGAPERSPVIAPPAAPLVAPPRAQPVAASAVLEAPAPPPLAPPPLAPPPLASAPTEAVQVAVPKRTTVPSPSAASAKPSLADEARGLARVQRALRDGDATTALGLLDEQDRRFRGGSLAAERTAARALAGCAVGRGQARAQAERFVAQHAGSPLAERVQRKCLGPR